MSLMSKEEQLQAMGDSSTANREQQLRAALIESQQRYEKLLQEQRQDIAELTKAVQKANETRVKAVSDALKQGAADTLAPLHASVKQSAKALDSVISDARTSSWLFRFGIVVFALWTALAVGVGYWFGGGGFHESLQRIEWNTTYPDSRVGISTSKQEIEQRITNQKKYEQSQQLQKIQGGE